MVYIFKKVSVKSVNRIPQLCLHSIFHIYLKTVYTTYITYFSLFLKISLMAILDFTVTCSRLCICFFLPSIHLVQQLDNLSLSFALGMMNHQPSPTGGWVQFREPVQFRDIKPGSECHLLNLLPLGLRM